MFFTFTLFGQKIYNNKNDYDIAIKEYNRSKESYDNYLKKLNFFKNYKYPKSKSYPKNGDEWFKIFEGDLKKLNIKIDNEDQRLYSDVRPEGNIYINLIEDPTQPNLVVKVTDKKMSIYDFKFCCTTLKFKDPGKPPIFIEKKVTVSTKIQKNDVKIDNKENYITKNDTIIVTYESVYLEWLWTPFGKIYKNDFEKQYDSRIVNFYFDKKNKKNPRF